MKRALVTGGGGVIGTAICRRLAAQGAYVYVHTHRRIDFARQIADEIGGRAVAFDVTDVEGSKRALEEILEEDVIQIIVNNAGIHDDAVLPGMKGEQWRRVVDVSLNGFFNVTQPLLMAMIRTRWGRIINMSSVAALIGNRGQTNYAAAKAGLHGATKSLALELAPRGITVNAVAPGIIETPMAAKVFTQEAIERLVPMKRAGAPDEVAQLVAFLASDHAGYISGQVIGINGAMA